MQDELGNEIPLAECRPSAGVEDLVIVPLVVIALAISKLLKAVFSILIYILDYAFPILLQLVRIPLLTARLIGDGMRVLEGLITDVAPEPHPLLAHSCAQRVAWSCFWRALSGASPCPARSASRSISL